MSESWSQSDKGAGVEMSGGDRAGVLVGLELSGDGQVVNGRHTPRYDTKNIHDMYQFSTAENMKVSDFSKISGKFSLISIYTVRNLAQAHATCVSLLFKIYSFLFTF